ncbi:MAG: hypothetical protein ACI4OJ_13625 [Lachnospiraceae bacterium]
MDHSRFGFFPTADREGPDIRAVLCSDAAITADFSDLAKNHCCATMFLNYCRYLDQKGRLPSRLHGFSDRELFRKIHRFVPNGPILSLRHRAPLLFSHLGIPARADRLPLYFWTPAKKKADLLAQCHQARKNPAALLVAAGPLSWHWILAVGSGSAGGKSCLYVVTGWHRQIMRYIPDAGCHILAAWELSSSACFTRSSSS